jgi:predicted MFS family arabinose efflux permease
MNIFPAAIGPGPDRTLRAAHRATQAEFFALGVAAAALGVHVPSIKQHYGLDEASLSLALLSAAGGGVLCLMVAGRIIGRFGARRTTLAAGLVLGAALSLLLAFDRLPALVAVMSVFGAAVGLFDVAINAEGTHLEERLGRKIVSTLHGMWSLGGMAGSAAGAALLQGGVAPATQLHLAALACTLVAVLAGLAMLPVHAPPPAADPAAPPHARPRGLLLLLGLLAALGMLAEGVMYDWSVLYIHKDLGAAPAVAALGYSSFSAAMALTRFGGDWMRARLAPARLLAGSALLAAGAMALVLLWGNAWVALVGFAVVGIGMANVVPILYVAGSRVRGVSPATGIALVSSMGYFGMVAGPPVVGGVAHFASLTWGLGLVVVAALLLAWGARRIGAAA